LCTSRNWKDAYHNGLQDFVRDRGQNTLCVVNSDLVVDPGESLRLGAVQDTEGDLDVLEI